MRMVALLVFWSSSYLAGGEAQPDLPHCLGTCLSHVWANTSGLITRAPVLPSPDGAPSLRLGISLWDEEDSLDDYLPDSGLPLFNFWGGFTKDDVPWYAASQHHLGQSASYSHPLRC